jgi:hypothetical protein
MRAVDTAGLMDTVEATCPQVLEQLEDDLLTVSTARLLLGKNNLSFLRKKKTKKTMNELRTESGHL